MKGVIPWKRKSENWRRPEFGTSEWCSWRFGSAKQHDDIEFTTLKGTRVILKWKKNEYRAYEKYTERDMKLGAIRVENLIEYIKQNF